MGCPSSVNLGENLVFSVTTHDPDTGVLTDADSLPAYRVYEEETGTPLLTGTMAKLDDPSTTGFYTESIAVTQANGFESGKTYTIYIEATVDSDTGAISYGFSVEPVLSTSSEKLALADSLGLGDLGIVQSISLELSDSVGMSEPSVLAGTSAILSDSLALVESLGLGRRLILTDSLGLSESQVREPKPLLKDVVVLVDTMARAISIILSDTVQLQEAFSSPIAQVLADSLGLSDSISFAIKMPLADILDLSEVIAGTGQVFALGSYFRQHQSLVSYFRQHQSLTSHLRGGS